MTSAESVNKQTLSAPNRAVWRIPLYAIFVAVAVLLPLDVGWPDFSFLLNMFVVAPLLLFATSVFLIYVLVQGVRSQLNRTLALSLLSTLIAVSGVAVFLEFHRQAIRDDGRWLIWSREYKAQVLAQPNPPNGHLKYIAWDSWGMFAQDFDEFLVFDPTDSFTTAHSTDSGVIDALPDVSPNQFAVRRLESRWYLITYP